jgi:hypothetical protein
MTPGQARQESQVADLRVVELAPGLEPGTCCLRETCAGSMGITRVASGQVRSDAASGECPRMNLSEPPVKMGRSLIMGMVLPGGSDPEPP